jgi:glycosyltransferase involved in cell wall biosynthesis
MKRLLLLTYHFAPSAASGTFRMLGFTRHLPKFGWQVDVVAPPAMPWEPSDPRLLEQVPAETRYERVPYPANAPKVLRWGAPNAVWLPRAWSACKRLLKHARHDAVLTSGPPHVIHLLGLWLQQAHRFPWIADFRDPWIATGNPRALNLSQGWFSFWEQRILRNADCVLANAPNATRLFQQICPSAAERAVTLTNGYDPEVFPEPNGTNHFDGTIRLLHAGELYAGRNPLPLLDALAALNKQPPFAGIRFRLEFLGRVHLNGVDLSAEIQRRGLAGDVVVRGQLPYQDSLQEMTNADTLVLFDGPGRKIGVPAKLYEYFGAGKPILALAERDGDTAQILRQSGLPQRIAAPTDAGQIAQALRDLASEIIAVDSLPIDTGRLRTFTRAHLAGRLAGILNQIVAPTPGVRSILETGHVDVAHPRCEHPDSERELADVAAETARP